MRSDAFKGATVKNMGPRAEEDIDWGYFVGRLDFTFFHQKTDNVRAQVGYEFYYKTEDHFNFKQQSAASWLGNQVSAPTVPYLKPLDNNVARANTEAIAHKIRGTARRSFNEAWVKHLS